MDRRNSFLLVRKSAHVAKRLARTFSKQNLIHTARAMWPTLLAFTFASAAHAQGTMDFTEAQTLMTRFKTFAIFAGAVICFGGLIFVGIRMLSGRFSDAIPGLFGALFGAGVLGWGAGWIGFDHGYAVTSHSSQGLTADRVLVNIDTNTHPELINPRFAYVSVSRAAQDAQIYTNAASSLASALSHDVTKTSAVEMGKPGDWRQVGQPTIGLPGNDTTPGFSI